MLCQNCEKNEATTHIKQVINGDTAEQHLCADCAKQLGYGDMFSGFGLSLSDMFGGFFGETTQQKSLNAARTATERCKKCGFSFQDIVREGRVGCADCYRTFYDKLKPSLQRIHGRVEHNGKVSLSAEAISATAAQEKSPEQKIAERREQMQEAIRVQDFERAAQLRDEIKELERGEDA